LDDVTAVAKIPRRISVLANDTDVDGDTISLISFTLPTKGLIKREGDDLIYTTKLTTAATDSFTYTVSDGHGGISIGTVNVDILDQMPPKMQTVRLYYGPNEFLDAGSLSHSTLPWAKVYRVAVVFNEGVSADPSALTLTGLGGAYPTTFAYDAATRTATWTPLVPIGMGRLTIRLFSSGVADGSGNHLSASWSRSVGLLAGDFDGNGIVDKKDLSAIKKNFSRPKKPLVRLADVDGNGIVNQADLDLATANMGKRLL
jgi:hypothetical protein